jgi:hypothetical protein
MGTAGAKFSTAMRRARHGTRPHERWRTGTEDAGAQNRRDRHIRFIAEKGRMAWQRATGYGRRSLAEMVCLQTTSSA